MRKCEGFEESIHAYLDNELGSEELKQFRSHLVTCQGCQRKVEIFKGLRITLKDKIVPVSAPASLKERILEREIKPVPVRHIFLFPRWAFALGIVIMVLGGITFYQQKIKPSHFLILPADNTIQRHVDNCGDCQKSAVKCIAEDMKMASAKKVELQKHLDSCLGCQEEILKIVKDCTEPTAWNIQGRSFKSLLALREKSTSNNYFVKSNG